MDQPKLERLLRLMKMLTVNNSSTVEEIADKLDISPRSVYRYLDTFRNAGFIIKKSHNCPKLDKSSPYFKDISDRHVEPFAFTTNYVQVWCYCLDEAKNKLFKTSRIGNVELMRCGSFCDGTAQRH